MRIANKRDMTLWLFCFLLAVTAPARAYVPVPKVFHHWEFHAFGGSLEIEETERVEPTEFRMVIVPGKQTIFHLRLPNGKGAVWGVPMSVQQAGVALLLLLTVAGYALLTIRRRWRKRRQPTA